MDLLGKKDLKEAFDDEGRNIIRTYDLAYLKCKQIWAGVNRPKGSEAIVKLLGHQLPYPVQTRWSTDYKCLSALLKEEAQQPGITKKLLEVTQTDKKTFSEFTEHELLILREYVELTAPIANGIDNLQGDKETFYGDLMPTIFSIRSKLTRLTALSKLGVIARVLLDKLVNKRFVDEFKLEEKARMAICAAISNPKYKAQWGTEDESEKALVIFRSEYDEIAASFHQDSDDIEIESEDFIHLRTAPLPSASTELTRFLIDQRKDFKMLDEYPVIKEIFLKTNTQMPTSAIVERMFNFAGMLDDPKRGRILPENFEMNVLLKVNSVFDRD